MIWVSVHSCNGVIMLQFVISNMKQNLLLALCNYDKHSYLGKEGNIQFYIRSKHYSISTCARFPLLKFRHCNIYKSTLQNNIQI